LKLDKNFLIIIIASILVYSAFVVISDLDVFNQKIINFKTEYLPIILILVPCGWMFAFLRWRILLKNIGLKIKLRDDFLIYFSGYSLAISPGRLGELLKAQLLKNKYNTPIKKSAPLVLVEKIYTLIGIVSVSIVGLWISHIALYITLVGISILVIIFIVIFKRKNFLKLLRKLSRFKFASKRIESIADSYEIIRNSFKPNVIILCSLLSITHWLIESVGVYFIFLSLGINIIDYFTVVFSYSSSILIGALSFIPGGIGVMEASFAGLLSTQNVDFSLALTATIFVRIFTLWYGVVAGFVALKFVGNITEFKS